MTNKKPLVMVVLEPGEYLVEVSVWRSLTWKHEGNGVVVGHGSKLRRVAIADAFNELHRRWEKQEGIDSDTLSHPEIIARDIPSIPPEAIAKVERTTAEFEKARAELQVLIENSDAGREYRRRHPR
jgi:hypothetical protein